MVCLLLIAAGTPAAGHWTTNPYAFQYDMTAYIRLTPVADQEHELAAFCGDECRGVGKWIKAENGTWIIQMRIRSNQAAGETIRFVDYDPRTDKELAVEGSVDFVSQSVAGLPGEPMELRILDLLPGDVNGDGTVNVTDVGMVIDHILEHTPAGFIAEAADINGDGNINVTDVGLIIDIILSDNSAREVLMTENIKESVEEIHEPQ